MILSELLVSLLTKRSVGKLTNHWMDLFPTPSEEQSLAKSNKPVNPYSTDSYFTIGNNLWSSGYVYIGQW